MFYKQVKHLAIHCHLLHDAGMAEAQHMHLKLKDYKKDICGSSEISVKGRMYDVQSVTIMGQYVDLLVISDMCEQEIVDEIVKSVKRTNPQSRKIPQPLVEFYCDNNTLFAANNIAYMLPSRGQLHGDAIAGILCGNSPDIPSPPPQQI